MKYSHVWHPSAGCQISFIGYALKLCAYNIKKAKELGMEKLLITCNTENIASENTIIANGGILENMIEVDGCKMKRYWITI